MEIKTTERLSFAEARNKYNLLAPSADLKKSFSAAVTTPVVAPIEKTKEIQSPQITNLMEMMTLLLAGQKDHKEKLEEQSKQIEDQTQKIAEQTVQISKLSKENERLKNENERITRELGKLKFRPAPTKPVKNQPTPTPVGGLKESLTLQSEEMDCSDVTAGGFTVQRGNKKQKITLLDKDTNTKS